MAQVFTPRRLNANVSSGAVPVSNQPTIISLPCGNNGHAYKQLDLLLTKASGATMSSDAEIAAECGSLVIRLNGREIVNMTVAEWLALTGFDRALTANKGVIPIRFAQLDARTEFGEDAAIFGTADVDSLEVELIWGTVATVTRVDASMTVLPNEPLGAYHSYRRFTPTLNGTSGVVFDTIKLTDRQLLAALHVKSSTVTKVKVELGDLPIYDVKRFLLDHELREYQKIPHASYTHLDFTRQHRHGHALPLGGNVRCTFDFSADPAGAVVMLAKIQEEYVRAAA